MIRSGEVPDPTNFRFTVAPEISNFFLLRLSSEFPPRPASNRTSGGIQATVMIFQASGDVGRAVAVENSKDREVDILIYLDNPNDQKSAGLKI